MVVAHSNWSGRALICALLCLCGLSQSLAFAGETRVAVATNFLSAFKVIAERFEEKTGHQIKTSSGSSGKLYVQIQNGAPFDLFFSADAQRPELLEKEGLVVSGSRFTYAVGRLTLWSVDPLKIPGDGEAVLRKEKFQFLAIANPKTAPYGQAAIQTLKALKLWERLEGRLVRGENIGQTFQFAFTENAQLGFVALSQVLDPKLKSLGSRWDVPIHLYAPLTQQAVLLKRGRENSAAKSLMDYMKEKPARDIIEGFGYGTD